MIDYEKLNAAYQNDGIYALQLEVGDLCYQGCIYCYMNAVEKETNTLSDKQISNILIDAKKLGISAIEWLGGEPLLRRSIFNHMEHAMKLGFRNNVWTGGLPLKNDTILKKTAKYASNGLISFHVSSVDPKTYEMLHPGRSKDDLKNILNSISKLIEIGYPSSKILNSVTFTGLQSSDDMIQTIDYFQDSGIKTSLNVYHTYLRPEISKKELSKYIPSKLEVANVHKRYAEQYNVNQLPMNCVNKQYCSATVAVLCDGSITPCATIRKKNSPSIHDNTSFYDIITENKEELILKKLKENVSESCRTCSLSGNCWGCRSRSFAKGDDIYGDDPRCFRKRT